MNFFKFDSKENENCIASQEVDKLDELKTMKIEWMCQYSLPIYHGLSFMFCEMDN